MTTGHTTTSRRSLLLCSNYTLPAVPSSSSEQSLLKTHGSLGSWLATSRLDLVAVFLSWLACGLLTEDVDLKLASQLEWSENESSTLYRR